VSVGLKQSTVGAGSINLADHDEAELSSDALALDKKFITDFAKFIADSLESEDDRTITFDEMNDTELMKRLSEYLGSGKLNVSINNTTIESAQALIEEQNLSEEQLAELDNPRSAKAVQAKQQKMLEAVREAYQEEAQKRLEAHRAEWDAKMHLLGGREYSGAELHAMHERLKDPKEQEAFEEDLMETHGITREEARQRRTRLQEYLELMEKQRNGQKLSDEERRRLEALQNTASVQADAQEYKTRNETGREDTLGAKDIAKRLGNEETSTSERGKSFASNEDGPISGPPQRSQANPFETYANDHVPKGLTSKTSFKTAANPDFEIEPDAPAKTVQVAIAKTAPVTAFEMPA
jgi:hypothetical protein